MTHPAEAAEPDFHLVDDEDSLANALDQLASARVLAVDTEADSLHSFTEKVCLIQLASDTGESYIVDPLALESVAELGPILDDPEITTVFHGADFDVVSLRRDFGFCCSPLFDTMVASQLLGDEKLSLRDLVHRFFGVELAKAYTRCDWGKRPLGEEQLAYSYYDVAYLVPLRAIQLERLQTADLLEEAEIEFRRLALREPTVKAFAAGDWGRIKGSRDLSTGEQAVLAELYRVRYDHASRIDRPLFKVIGNDTMLRLARAKPRGSRDLHAVRGLSSYARKRMQADLLDAVKRGLSQDGPPPRTKRRTDPARRLDLAAQKRLGRLRDWRNDASEGTGLTTYAILPNYAMFEVAKLRPRTEDELAALDGIGGKRARRWGAEILKLLA
jgi:ribonuclease D